MCIEENFDKQKCCDNVKVRCGCISYRLNKANVIDSCCTHKFVLLQLGA